MCRKLGLEPGMRMLDVGCGWGSLSLHAAEHSGTDVTVVTTAAGQKQFIDARTAQRGLGDRVEMGEHVGEADYPTYVQVLQRAVRPGGRVLVQQRSRTARHPCGGPYTESSIAPDMHMRPVSETVAHLERGGLPGLTELVVRRSSACGGSLSSAARWPSGTGAWGSTSTSRCARARPIRCRHSGAGE